MSDPTNDHVHVDVTIDSVGATREGFGKPGILAHSVPWTGDRTRVYGAASDYVSDGGAADDPVGRALARIFAQNPAPPLVTVLRSTLSVLQQYVISVAAVRDLQDYVVRAKGTGFVDATATATSDSTATNDEIAAALVTALNAVALRNFTAEATGAGGSHVVTAIADQALVVADTTFTADSTTDEVHAVANGLLTGDGPVRVANTGGGLPAGLVAATDYWWIKVDADNGKLATSRANALAGAAVDITTNGTGTQTLSDTASTRRLANNAWFSLEVGDVNLLSIAQTTAAPVGLAADLDAIMLVDGTWYDLVTLYDSTAYVLAAAAWVETNKRLYMVDTCETAAITTAESGGTDLLKQLKDLGYARTMGVYHPNPAAMCAAAWAGRWLPTDPGRATPKFKSLAGVETVALTSTHRANLRARFANTYELVAGVPITWEGSVPSRTYRFLDVTRNLDWLEDQLQKTVFETLAGADIVPYTPEGVALVEGAVAGIMGGVAISQGVIAARPAPVITVPDFDTIPDVDKEDRVLNNVKASGVLQGAVHKVNVGIDVHF